MKNFWVRIFIIICLFHVGVFSAAAVNWERGEVEPARLTVGCSTGLNAERALHSLHTMPISANLVFSNAQTLRISQTQALWAFAHNGKEFFAGISTPAGGTLVANHSAHDSNLWEDDSYEFFLLDESGKNGCHFIVNSKGAIFDSVIKGGQEDSKWNCQGARVVQKQDKGSWNVVLSIPISELKALGAGSRWKAAIYRASCGKRQPEGINQPQSIFYCPDFFTTLALSDSPLALQAKIDQKQLMDGKLASSFSGYLPKGMELSWCIGVSPLNYATYDAYNKSAETPVADGRISRAGDFQTAYTSYKLPPAGIVHLLAKSGSQILFERYIPYDLNDFNKLDIAALYADGKRTHLCAELTLPTRQNAVEYTYGLKNSQGKVEVEAKSALAGSGSVKLPLKRVKPGKYIFYLKAASGVEISHDFTVLPEKPEWLGNNLGKTAGSAPAPWSNIVVNGDRASVWNRTITFRGIPSVIESAQGKIVENIRFEANGTPMELVSSKWVKKAGDEAECESVFQFKGGRMKVISTLEFDGLVWLDCEFIPDKGKNLPTVAFRMDMPEGVGRFIYTAEHNAKGSVMLAPADSWFKNMLTDKPTFWVGSPERGIFFLADDLRGWKLRHYTKSAQVSAEKDGRRVITVPVLEQILTKPGESRRISFSLQGTPTRPMPVGWRDYKINAKRNNVRLYQHNITELFNVPMPVRKHARNDIKNWRDRGVNALPYLATIAVSHFTDEFKWYSEQWRITPQARGALKPVNPEAYTLICPKGEGYTDWYLWNIDKMIDAIDSNGLYFDFGQPSVYLCTNTLHGCGWQDNHGVMRPSLRIRATRDMQKRIYTLLKQKRPDGLIALHNSGGLVPAFHCLADITWNGEQTCVQMFHNGVSYNGIYEPIPFMLEQHGSIYGVPAVFIPQFLRAIQLFDINRYGDYNKIGWQGFSAAFHSNPEARKQTWFLSGLLTVANGTYSADWGMSGALDGLHTMQDAIGWSDNVEFFGWYDSRNPFPMTSPANAERVKASSFRGSKGWMIVAVNDSKETQQIRIALPAEHAGKTFRMQPDDVTLSPKNGAIELELQPSSAAFITVL